jgi:hypothetical protein
VTNNPPPLPPLPELTPEQVRDSYLERLAYHHEESGNPTFVWAAWNIVSKANMEIPKWILEYFDCCATSLLALAETDSPKDANAVTKTFGFICEQGRRPLEEAVIAIRDDVLGMAVSKKMFEGEQKKYAEENAADNFKTSPSTMNRAYKRLEETLKIGKK